MNPKNLPVEIFRRPYQRHLKVRVKANGVIQVYCGSSVKEPEIRRFLEQVKPFIKKSYKQLFHIQSQLPRPFDSEAPWIPWLGEKLSVFFDANYSVPTVKDNKLLVSQTHFNVENLQQLYKRHAESLLEERIQLWSGQMHLHPSKLILRGQKSRWGSCSTKGTINLNWKILIAPLGVIDYLAVHELAHLKHHNHSADFWNLVERHQPLYKDHERWLKDHQHWAEFLDPDSDLYNPAINRESVQELLGI